MLVNGMIDEEQAMKRIVCFAAALLLAACSQETLPATSEIVETPESKTYTVSLQATIDPETRLSFSASNGVGTWDSGDQVALFTQGGSMVIGDATAINGSSATFTFTIQDGDKIADGATVYYPASIAVANNPNQIVLPASFDNLEVMKKTIPMKAAVSGKTMAFRHLASMVYVDAPTSTPSHPSDRSPQYAVFSVGKDDTPITGTFTVGDGTLTPVGNSGTTTIRAKWTEGAGYCFVLPATTYNGFSFSIISDITHVDGKEVYFTFYQKKRSSSFPAKLATMLKMPAFDPQCKEFYLTSTETDWSDNVISARMIQTGANSFLGALYSHKGLLGDRDLGLRILQKYNLGTHMHNTIGADGSPKATFGQNTGNINGNPEGVYKVSITLNQDSWTYTSEWVDNEYHHDQLYLLGDFTDWEQGRIAMDQPVGHNWTMTVTFDSDVSGVWKIYNGSWYTQWNDGHIDADHMSSGVSFNNSYAPDGTLNLPAGTYNVFFNDAIGWIMFEKK
jgi:hypothetical protein